MVDFRRWIIALTVLALFAGLASAQVPGAGTGAGPLTCTASVAVPPQLRSEGLTDLIGDIVITCTGGTALANGSVIPTANFTVSLPTNVTSRIVSGTNISEAMLLIDEPGSGLVPVVPGYGPAAAQNACVNPVGAGVGGCQQYAQTSTGGLPIPSGSATTLTAPSNVFFGIIPGAPGTPSNQVVFNGIPILPPVSTATTRVFRITNIRANIAGVGGPTNGTGQLLASVSISGSTSVPISNPVLIAGFIQAGMSTTSTLVRNPGNSSNLGSNGTSFQQCNSQNLAAVGLLQFTENFATAFKTRVMPTAAYNGQAGTSAVNQNIPGTIYNSESGFIYTATPGTGSFSATPGLADFGTRLKATFNNIPSTVRLFVTTTNLAIPTTGNPTSTSSTINTPPAGTSQGSYAVLVVGETVPDGNGTLPAAASTNTTNSGNTTLAEIPVVNGTATAVWEVVNTNPAQLETFTFGVYTSYTANTAANTPPPTGTTPGTVNLSFAPISTDVKATATGPIPRFADLSTAKGLISVNICQTLLLFPYVTNASGFETGLSIANTSSDPVGTSAQNGTCTLTFYDGSGKNPAFKTPNVASGTVWADIASDVTTQTFTGYVFALCNFQFAHGFAFISDVGARNLAMGYLPLIINNGATVTRNTVPPAEMQAH